MTEAEYIVSLPERIKLAEARTNELFADLLEPYGTFTYQLTEA